MSGLQPYAGHRWPAHRRWTPARDAMLRDLWRTGAPIKAIAATMGGSLTEIAIRDRARKIGLVYCEARKAAKRAIAAELGAARARQAAKAVASRKSQRAAAAEALRVRIWDLAATSAPMSVIAKKVGRDHHAAAAIFAKGRPDNVSWHPVNLEHFAPALRPRARMLGVAVIMNTVAMRWGVPATAIFGLGGGGRCLRTPAVVAARTEVAARLYLGADVSTLVCGALLRIDHTSVIGAVRRFERREEFAAVRAELQRRAAA